MKIGAKVGDLTVVRAHGEGDLIVTETGGEARLLVFGTKEAIDAESSALAGIAALGGTTSPFPAVVRVGHDLELGQLALLTLAIGGEVTSILDLDLPFEAGVILVRQVLDAAAAMDAAGYTWEPAPTDLHRTKSGELVVLRARGARKRLVREPFDAKRMLEALAGALLPHPFGLATPDVIRLLLPRFNFSTAATRSIQDARDDLARAEAVRSAKTANPIAELCDPGLRRHHNEDATAVARGDVEGEPFAVLVVADGVSSTTRSGEASALASKIARDRLVDFARTGEGDARAAVAQAIRAAHVEICAARIDYGDGTPPGTTIVVALVFKQTLTVGWVGDSRAYWIAKQGSELCTTDHSWLNDVITKGSMSLVEAMESPFAHAITKCVGPLEEGNGSLHEVEPDVRTKTLATPGHVVLCTDGLWNYFPSAQSVADLVRDAGEGADAEAIARYLVCRALAEGGGDNVSVAVYALESVG